MKKLSERQAWVELATEIESYRNGICAVVAGMWRSDRISDRTFTAISNKAQSWAEKSKCRWKSCEGGGWFAAALDADGAKLRAAFCRKQAKKLTRKKVKP